MGGINVKQWLIGGVAAAAVMFVLEGLSSVLYQEDMLAAMEAFGLSGEMSSSMILISVTTSLLVGLTLVFFYAAVRPRFGPGPRTAAIVGFVLWLGSYLLSILSMGWLGIFPSGMLVLWALIGLVELQAAAWVGGRLYREA